MLDFGSECLDHLVSLSVATLASSCVLLGMDYGALSRQILDVCLEIHRGERVWIDSWDHTLELASQLSWETKSRGCDVLLTFQTEESWYRSIINGPEPVDGLSSQQAAVLRETDVYIFTLGPRAPVKWEQIPPKRRKAVTIWFFERNRFVEEWKQVAQSRKVRMLGIEATLATPERAQALGLDFSKWSEVMYAGCLVDYREIARRGGELGRAMGGEGEAHITSPYGTDFRFELVTRPVDIVDGLATLKKAETGVVTFLPTGCVEASALEESANGTIVYDVPIHSGAGDVNRLTVKVVEGQITEHSAAQGSEIFDRYLKGTEGDAGRFAFFGLGLNPKLCHGFTQDDKVLGGVTVGFGDNQTKGGKNRAEGDWWASLTAATVRINQRLIMKDGQLLI